MTKLLGIAGLLFGGALLYSYYKRQVSNASPAQTTTTAVDTGTQSQGLVPAPAPTILSRPTSGSIAVKSSIATASPFSVLTTPTLFVTRKMQSFS